MKYYIGVDGGGTKTHYALFDESKNIVAEHKGPGSNHENLEGSFDEAAKYIWDGIKVLLEKSNKSLNDVGYTLMGLAGIDHPFQHDEMVKRLTAYGLSNFAVYNDGYIVVKAGSESGAAIGLNNGTGTCCNSIDSDGKMLMLSGLGDFTGDIGNGHWIAMISYKLIYDYVFLGLEKTAMTDMFFNEFGIKNRDEFLGSVSELEECSEKYIMRLIDFFFDAAEQGDAPVLKTIDQMALRSAQLICAHLNQRNFAGDEVEVVLSGSIFTKLPSQMYVDAIKEKISKMSDRKFKFITLQKAPVTGCVNWIFQEYVK